MRRKLQLFDDLLNLLSDMKNVECGDLTFVLIILFPIFFLALWLACSAQRTACIKVLLKLGAQDIGDKNGILPSQLMPF